LVTNLADILDVFITIHDQASKNRPFGHIDIFENYQFEMFNVICRAMKMQSGKADLAVYSYSVG